MRPEYKYAVEAVRWGWSLWSVFLLPACLIWYFMFFRLLPKLKQRVAIGGVVFVVASGMFWMLIWFHANRVLATKYAHMRTEVEARDWADDSLSVFARFAAIPVGMAYCGLNFLIAWLVRSYVSEPVKTSTASGTAETGRRSPGTNRGDDENPYTPPEI